MQLLALLLSWSLYLLLILLQELRESHAFLALDFKAATNLFLFEDRKRQPQLKSYLPKVLFLRKYPSAKKYSAKTVVQKVAAIKKEAARQESGPQRQ